ncbi:uncharacterized protein LOC120347357 [Styela clava]|uniref:uncharacterized protein LOC120347357 n=1 Tax=Styela clava TaxID=7725 RepID=UPI0019392CE7|nr:uncharacterized protein LOC120347357 [Styela clava]
MKFAFCIIIGLLLTLAYAAEDEECYTRNGCGKTRKRKSRLAEDYWINVNKKTDTCTMCLCGLVKKHTQSCIVVDKANDAPHKKKGILGRIYHEESKLRSVRNRKNMTVIIRDEEIELTKSEAKNIECGDEPEPIFNNRKKKYEFPPMKFVHYLYTEKESYCCQRKGPVIVNIPTSCYKKYDSKCEARIVTKKNSSKLCELPKPSAAPVDMKDPPNKRQ